MEAFNVEDVALFLFMMAPDNKGGKVGGEVGDEGCPRKAICWLG